MSDRLHDVESRLQDVEKNITRLNRQLSNKRNTSVTIAPEEKERIRQQIEDLREEIQQFEQDRSKILQEKSQILAEQAEALEIPETEAKNAVTEIVEAVTQIETQPDPCPDEVLQLLRQIRDKLNAPGPTAAGKLKGVISSSPPFIQLVYEAELDTGNFAHKYFPTLRKLLGGATKK